jgi:hypothetical protein
MKYQPICLAGLRTVTAALVRARQNEHPILFGLGAHVV